MPHSNERKPVDGYNSDNGYAYEEVSGRPKALRQLCNMADPGIVLICADYGVRKSSILSRCVMAHLERGMESRIVDFFGLTPDNAYLRLKDVMRWCHKKPEGGEQARALVACDNMPIGDESDVTRIAGIIRRLALEGFLIVVATNCDGELLYEQLGESTCLWTCDLCVERPQDGHRALLYDAFSHGIPVLDDALNRIEVRTYDVVPSDPSYQEPYIRVLESLVRETLIIEERTLRSAILLLGSGTMDDLNHVLGEFDEVLWRLLARDAPFFGVDVAKGTFRCVAAGYQDSINISYASLSAIVRPWPHLVARCARLLARRGDFARAAVVSLMCEDDRERCSVALEWGPMIIDVGEVSVVADALETARLKGLYDLAGFYESTCVLGALTASGYEEAANLQSICCYPTTSHHARLALMSRALLRDAPPELDSVDSEMVDDALSGALAAHAKALSLLFRGRLAAAYDVLLQALEQIGGWTVSSTLLQVDYTLCSLLMGIVSPEMRPELSGDVSRFFERSGLPQMTGLFDSALTAGMLLSGRTVQTGELEMGIQRAARWGDSLLQGLLLMTAGVADMRAGSLTRGLIRLRKAVAIFDGLGASELSKIGRLLYHAARARLGEKVTQPEVRACKGVSGALDGVVAVLAAALSSNGSVKRLGLPGWERMNGLHWIVNVLSNDFGVVSQRFRKAMPASWADAQLHTSMEVDDLLPHERLRGFSRQDKKTVGDVLHEEQTKQPKARIEIRLLGGFELYVDGVLIPNSRLDKRRAKALLVLLGAMPGHVARRYIIMETIWPSYDYQTANKCVYSATSALRSEIKAALQDPMDLPIVVANKAQGTVALNMTCVACDVEAFEQRARTLIDMEDADRSAVALCREVESLYRGDLFVPPTDGMGVIATRAKELKSLFADAMVSGAHAALNSGMKLLACRFAHKAHAADELREDAMVVLIASLCAAGRQVEAQRCYERFVGRVADLTRKPPSRQLRESVGCMLKGMPPQIGDPKDRQNKGEITKDHDVGEGENERQLALWTSK